MVARPSSWAKSFCVTVLFWPALAIGALRPRVTVRSSQVVAALAFMGVRLVDEDLDVVAPEVEPVVRAQPHDEALALM